MIVEAYRRKTDGGAKGLGLSGYKARSWVRARAMAEAF